MNDLTNEALSCLRLAADAISDAASLVKRIDNVDDLRSLLREARDLTVSTHELRGAVGTRTLVVLACSPEVAELAQDAAKAAADEHLEKEAEGIA